MNRAGVDLRGPHGRRRFGRLPLVVVALIATGLSLGWSFRSAPPRLALGFSVREETLDETGWFSSAALAVSSDGRHVAWGRHEGSTVRMVVDGKAGRAFDGLSLQPPRFAAAPGSGAYAYVAQRGGLEVVVWGRVGQGEVESRGYRHVPQPAFSADGEHLAWLVSGDWAVAAPGDREDFVVVDGLEGPQYARVWDLAISLHGDRVAYGATVELPVPQEGRSTSAPAGAPPGRCGRAMVVNGREGKSYDMVRRPVFSPDGTRLAYTAHRDRAEFLVVDGVEGPPYRAINYGSTVFSPDSRRVAYGAQRDDDAFLVVDGVEGPASHGAGKFLGFGGPVFSPDSRRVAYAVRRHEKWVPVVDGVPGRSAPALWGLQFSPDSRRCAYLASRRAKYPLQPFLVLDGKAQRRYAEVAVPVFSPDSRYLAYAARSKDGHWHVIVDGQEAADLDASDGGALELVFSGPDALVAVYVRQERLLRVVVDILGP